MTLPGDPNGKAQVSVPRLWLCADLDHPNAPELVARVAAALTATPACVWLRGTGAGARAMLSTARALRSLTAREGCALLVGDRVDVAALAGADGVHLPGRGVTPDEARALLPAGAWLSAAVHDAAQLDAVRGRVEAVVLSPFGAVPGKGEPLGPAGFAALRAGAGGACAVALGGLATAADVRAALAAGADAVAVRRALMDADDPAAACAALARALERTGH